MCRKTSAYTHLVVSAAATLLVVSLAVFGAGAALGGVLAVGADGQRAGRLTDCTFATLVL